MKHIGEALVEVIDDLIGKQPKAQPAEEAAHCVCPLSEAYAGMDETAEWAQTHWGVVGGAA